MADLVIGALVPVLIEKLASMSSQYLLDFFRSVGVHKLLKEWGATLQSIRDVLEDAEEKQLTNREVRRWLDDLHDLVYDVDDFVDELATEAQARRIKSSYGSRPSTSRFPNCIPAASSINICGINPFEFKFYYKMKPKIADISSRLQDISNRRIVLELKQINNQGRETWVPLQTTSLPPTHVFGREKEKNEIVDMLMKPEADSTQVPVITIQGMGGLGKTTLAQDVYKEVEGCFDLRAWVCVSDVFDVSGITKRILKQIPGADNTEKLDLNQLQENLKRMLSGKKFLVVLDDVWNEDYGKWELLLRPFPSGAAVAGSRILATTRNEPVASIMSLTNSPYRLKKLEEDDCLSLLASHAFGRENFDHHLHLKESGELIVKKCGYLPLAIKTVAGLLRNKLQPCEWEVVINSSKWTEESHGILPALRLSYYHLPYHLKRCFAYCSLIPKDYIFDKTELILLWMAEGLLQQPAGGSNKQTEDFGHDCFQELLSRSFFQFTSGSTTQFIMHDLINDLVVHVAGEKCFRMDEVWDEIREYKISERTRHLSFISQYYEVSNKFNIFNKAHRSRTFLPLPPHKFCTPLVFGFHISDTLLALSLSRLQSLRVLNLKDYEIIELPDMIGVLKHLRYLNLSYTRIEQLPQVVCRLYNLQTLSLNGCFKLRELPSSIGCLTNLRHLDLESTYDLKKMPSGIGKLTSLQTLSKVIVGRDIGLCNLKDLKDLRNLHGTLSIEELQNVTDDQDADLRSKEHLEILKLQWNLKEFVSSAHAKQVLEKLKPHCNLKELEIKGYGSDGFPSWVGGQSMSNVVKIHLYGCSEITQLPPLGELPLLKDLVIKSLGNITSVGAEFYGGRTEEIAFPSLETLKFHEMRKWNLWSLPVTGKGLFPRLRDLKIDGCPELGSIPTLDLPFLCRLELLHCKEVWLERLINLTSLKTMWINDVAGLTRLPEQFVNSLVSLEEAKFEYCEQLCYLWRSNGTSLEGPFNRLNSLNVWNCNNLIYLLEEGEEGLPRNLKKLYVSDCAKLEKLPNGLHGLESLQEISISNCGNLISLLEKGEQGLPRNLKKLEVSMCAKLEKLPNGLHGLESLQEISINYCNNLISLLEEGEQRLSRNLKKLEVSGCAKLEKLPNGLHGLASLQEIRISDCTSLVWDMTDRLPKSLKTLELCNNHEGFRNIIRTWSDGSLSSSSYFASLVDLRIDGCSGLESFWVTCFPMLSSLSISDCADLKSLPDGIQGLASLKDLYISNCGNLGPVPEKDLPPSLIKLSIYNVGDERKKEKSVVLSDWGFHRLTSLRSLTIGGFEEVVSFEQVVGDSNSTSTSTSYLFPPSLTYLSIVSFPNLKSLSMGFHNLTSLRQLMFWDCPNLKSLSKGLHNLTSLRELDIQDCPKLESLAGADDDDQASLQIISSLHSLYIDNKSSEVLRKRCKKEKGKYWPTIQHIPGLYIKY